MKIAYLILAHNTPRHLQKLITALSSSSSSFFIHLDKKSNAADFANIKGSNIYFVKDKIRVFWGSFSMVEATLILIKAAILDEGKFDRFVLLSGADYPIRSTDYIESFFKNNPTKEFISLSVPSFSNNYKVISRLSTYQLQSTYLNKRLNKFLRKILRQEVHLHREYRYHFEGLAPYGGSSWWALSREACGLILDFVGNKPKIVNFFKNTTHPDEAFFQIILGNSRLKSRIVKTLTYADWSTPMQSAHPCYITQKHLALFNKASSFTKDGVFGGEFLFARKFRDDSQDLIAKLLRI